MQHRRVTPPPKREAGAPQPQVCSGSKALGRCLERHFHDLHSPSKSGLTPSVATGMPLGAQAHARCDAGCALLGGASRQSCRGLMRPPPVSRLLAALGTQSPGQNTNNPLPGAGSPPSSSCGSLFGLALIYFLEARFEIIKICESVFRKA